MIVELMVVGFLLVALFAGVWWREYQHLLNTESFTDASHNLTVWLISIPVIVVTLLLYAYHGRHPELTDWLSEQQQFSQEAKRIAAGEPLDTLAGDIPVGALVRVLAHEMARSPTTPGWFSLSYLLSQSGAYPAAVESAQKALEREPESPEIRMMLASTLISANQGELTDEARAHLDFVLARYPDHDGALMMLAMSSSRAGQFATAVEAWQRLLDKHHTGEAVPLLKRGLAHAETQLQRQHYFSGLTIEVAAEDTIPAGGTLFVSLRAEGSDKGPPAAAKRMLVRTFPKDMTLVQADWMQAYPDPAQPLWVFARYATSPGASVDEAGIIALPVTLSADADVAGTVRLTLRQSSPDAGSLVKPGTQE